MMTLRPGQRILNIPAIGVKTSRRAVAAGGNGLLNNLIAYWKLDEASGDALDAHTNGLTLADGNTVTNAAGKVYTLARQYTAANSEFHTRTGDDALLSTGDVDYTLATWLYLDSKSSTMYGPAKWIVGTGAREYAITYITATDRFRWLVSQDGTTSTVLLANSFGAVSTATWYLVICWHDASGNQLGISVNATVDTASYSSGSADSTTPFAISPDAGRWNGRIGPVAMWKSAAGGGGVLTAAQRSALWNGGAGLPYASFTV